MPIITVPKVLREKLGDDGAEALVELIGAAGNQVRLETLMFVEEKFERRLGEEISKLEVRLREEIAKLDVRISALDVKLSDVRGGLLQWMFIFWVGQIGALLGILFAFFPR